MILPVLVIISPLALITAILAIWDMKRHPERHGMGRAIFGLVMGIIGTIILLFALIMYALAPK